MYNVTSVKEAGAIVAALEDIKDAMEGGYPEPTSATDGQVLTADGQGGAAWEDAQGGLPSYTSPTDSGKVLKLIEQDMEGNLSPEWAQINTVPAGGTQGQVLTKGASGYNWANPSGGGGIGFEDDTDIEVVFDDKGNTYILDYAVYTEGANIFASKSSTSNAMEGTYLTRGVLAMQIVYGSFISMPKSVIFEAHLENANGISNVDDIIPLYTRDYSTGSKRFYYDTSKINSSTSYIVVMSGYYDTAE